MGTEPSGPYLEVHVKFPIINPPSDAYVSIGFPELEQAKWYHEYITQTRLHRDLNLLSWRRDRQVSVRLPSRFANITASSRCNGFYFTVNDKGLAGQWVESMVVWKFLPGSETQLYVVRNWAKDAILGRLLLDRPKYRQDQRYLADTNPNANFAAQGGREAPRYEVVAENSAWMDTRDRPRDGQDQNTPAHINPFENFGGAQGSSEAATYKVVNW